MNYTEEQFKTLAPFEDNFRTALEGNWSRRISIPDQRRIKATYEAATDTRVPYNVGCASCVVRILRQAGRLWFEDKNAREGTKSGDQVGTKSQAAEQPQPENGEATAKKATAKKTPAKAKKVAKTEN